ncbi:hypothetical protein J5N97_014545 [Dioscorea zingiberensis]|uniref:Uncharacterized protein n=1 Tax=Dioscorea zingiberensis TaxID=325984 RepID=A0A9D5CSP2_9LILI|nr:hypothetical protein J5N97_014545 [Dioscorea zingiberensis]
MLKVEQRRKEALSRAPEEGAPSLETTLHDIVSRYSFMDLWPCSSKELDHLSRQEWLAKNLTKKVDKSILQGANSTGPEKDSSNSKASTQPTKVVYPDTSRMVIYDPRQSHAGHELQAISGLGTTSAVSSVSGGNTNANDEILKAVSPALMAFISHLPAVDGPSPDVDIVLSILLQNPIPTGQPGKPVSLPQMPGGPAPSTSDISGSSKSRLNPNGSSQRLLRETQSGKRKDLERQEDDESTTVQSRPLPRDVFRIRQMQRTRGVSASQTGSAASGGSAFSGEQSISN